MDIDTYLSQLFKPEILEKVHTMIQCMNENKSDRHVYVHMGNGSNGKSMFLSFLNALFYDTDIDPTFCTLHEITRYDFDVACSQYHTVHFTCNTIHDIPYINSVPHTIIPYETLFVNKGPDPEKSIVESIDEFLRFIPDLARQYREKYLMNK